MPADHQCGYHGYLHQFGVLGLAKKSNKSNAGLPDNVADLRRRLAEIVDENGVFFNRENMGDTSLYHRWNKIGDPKILSQQIWAGHDSHFACAFLSGRHVVVLYPTENGEILKFIYPPTLLAAAQAIVDHQLPSEAPADSIIIALVGNNHYMSVVPK